MAKKKKKENPIKKDFKKNKELYWVLGTMLLVILVFFASYNFFKGLNEFEYKGLKFVKERYSEVDFYHYWYYFEKGTTSYRYNLYLKNDPRENDVPIEGNIIFKERSTTYISVNDTGLTECGGDGVVAVAALSDFLSGNFIKLEAAHPDNTVASQNNITYANCDTHMQDKVILIQVGDETKIENPKDNCHVISVANCEIIKAVEKFEVQAILDAKEYDKESN